MTQSTPCPQQTGTFTSVLASAQALGEEGGDSNEQLLLLLLPLPCSEHTGAQGTETKKTGAAWTSWMLPVSQGQLDPAGRPEAPTHVSISSCSDRGSQAGKHGAVPPCTTLLRQSITPSSSHSLRYQATPHTPVFQMPHGQLRSLSYPFLHFQMLEADC